jgi:hypothetical protein
MVIPAACLELRLPLEWSDDNSQIRKIKKLDCGFIGTEVEQAKACR